MMRRQRWGSFTAVALLGWTLALLLPLRAAAIVIDNFSDAATTIFPPGVTRTTVGTTTVTDTGRGEVIGAVRTLTVQATALDNPGLDNVSAGVSMATGILEYNSTVGANGLIDLLYDANGAGLGADFTGEAGLEVVVQAADAASVPYTVTVTLVDNLSNPASSAQTITASGARAIKFPLSGFAGVHRDALFSIQLALDPGKAGDLRLAQFATFGSPPNVAPLLSSHGIVALATALSLLGSLALGRSRRTALPSDAVSRTAGLRPCGQDDR